MNKETHSNDSESPRWQRYYTASLEQPIPRFLNKAISLVENKDRAIDIGAGHLRDAKHLVEVGFKDVTAFDSNPAMNSFQPPEMSDVLHCEIRAIEEYDYPANSFDLVYLNKILHYVHPEQVKIILKKIIGSVREGGILAMNVYGPQDEWSKNSEFSFFTPDELKSFLAGFEIKREFEEEKDEKTARDINKHSHYITIIAKKYGTK